jgi:phosphatidate cytidylyltransferase
MLPALGHLFPKIKSIVNSSHMGSFLFSLYAIGMVSCVTRLRRKLLKQQLLLLSVIHMAAYFNGLLAEITIECVKFGKFFFVYPSLLVISNDIFAYFVGKLIGRTPLIALSPNKTVEGFIGGFFFTFILGHFMSYLKLKGIFFYDPAHRYLSEIVDSNSRLLNFPLIYIYNIAFVFAASFLAPFCGFIASAIKRSFQKKDFGNIIPGHGGIVDRFDCQVFMVFFTYYFLSVFGNTKKESANLIFKVLLEHLSDHDLERLARIIDCKKIK